MDNCLFYTFQCLSFLGFRNWVVKNFAFNPNKTPSYTLRTSNYEKMKFDQSFSSLASYKNLASSSNSNPLKKIFTESSKDKQSILPKPIKIPKDDEKYLKHSLYFIDSQKKLTIQFIPPDDIDVSGYILKNSKGLKFPILVVQPKQLRKNFCILYSNNNRADIGVILDSYLDISMNLNVTVVAYEYPGSGQSEGEPNDLMAIENIETTYQFILEQLGFKWSDVILYGQSIGSGPSTILYDYMSLRASRYKVAGLVIQNGILSGMRVISKSVNKHSYYDVFPNIHYIERVKCKVLIFHGSLDTVSTLAQAKQFQQICQENRTLYKFVCIEGADHNNIQYEDNFRQEYFIAFREFLIDLEDEEPKSDYSEFQKSLDANQRQTSSFKHIYNERSFHSISVSSRQTQPLEITNRDIKQFLID